MLGWIITAKLMLLQLATLGTLSTVECQTSCGEETWNIRILSALDPGYSVTQSGFEETNQQHNSFNDHLSHDSSPKAA